MGEVRATGERLIGAPPARAYAIIADYRRHHPNILPPAFSDYRVEEGGVGAGTVVSFKIRAGRRPRAYRMRVAEPEPGRLLKERDEASSLVTRFVVEPADGGSRVRIETVWQGAGGFGGLMERLFAPRFLARLYADELARLDRYAKAQGIGDRG